MPYSDEDRQFLADHGDPGPEDWEVEQEDRNERMRFEPTLNSYARQK